MNRINKSYFIFLFSFVLIAATKPTVIDWFQELTQEQQAGKDVYTQGIGVTDIKVVAQMSGVEVPATVMACINCHNAQGTGNPEGGIVPSNITWAELTKSYGGKHQDGSTRPPYNERSLRKVIATGVDPVGNVLHSTMPRYSMTRTDMDNLIEYLKVIGSESQSGITNTSIKVGILLPEAKNGSKNDAVQQMVSAYSDRFNATQGIYNRTLEPVFIKKNEPFNGKEFLFMLGFGNTSTEKVLNEQKIPGLFPFSKDEVSNGLKNSHTFYTYPSLIAQSLALVDFMEQQHTAKTKRLIVLHDHDTTRKKIASAIHEYALERYGIKSEVLPLDSESITSKIKSEGDVVFFLGQGVQGNVLAQTLAKENKMPYLLLPGSVSGINMYKVPPPLREKVFVGYPTWVSEQSFDGMQLYRTLQKEYDLPQNWKRNQLDMLSLLLTAENCLKQAGRELNRDRFKEILEGLYQYSNGLSPAVTYNINKRVGSENLYIVGYNPSIDEVQLITTITSKEK